MMSTHSPRVISCNLLISHEFNAHTTHKDMCNLAHISLQGAAALISNKALLTPAAGILAVEAYHAGAVRTLLFQSAFVVVKPYGATVSAITGVRTSPSTSYSCHHQLRYRICDTALPQSEGIVQIHDI